MSQLPINSNKLISTYRTSGKPTTVDLATEIPPAPSKNPHSPVFPTYRKTLLALGSSGTEASQPLPSAEQRAQPKMFSPEVQDTCKLRAFHVIKSYCVFGATGKRVFYSDGTLL